MWPLHEVMAVVLHNSQHLQAMYIVWSLRDYLIITQFRLILEEELSQEEMNLLTEKKLNFL